MTVFSHFFSDPHFGHSAVIKYAERPFQSADEMDAAMIAKYRERVRDDDFVLWAGDLSFHSQARTREIVRELPGRKALVLGNHDRETVTDYLKMGFEFVVNSMFLYMAGCKVIVSHYPPAGSNRDVRYLERRPQAPGKGEFVLHGHTHESERLIKNRIHVGVDAWDFSPAPTTDIVQLIVQSQSGAQR
jgi:calcineurin-like phosphoesterase family protein